MKHVLDTLRERGFIKQIMDEDNLRRKMNDVESADWPSNLSTLPSLKEMQDNLSQEEE